MNPITMMSFDPGSKHTRWVILAGDRHTQQYVTSGTEASEPAALLELINTANLERPITHYAVETMGRFAANPKIMLSLLETAEVSGTLIGLTTATGKPVFTMPANAPKGKVSWRTMLCGARDGTHAGDATVQAYLKMVLPSLPASTNVHVRDAAGLGVVAMRCTPKLPRLEVQERTYQTTDTINVTVGFTPPFHPSDPGSSR